MEGLKLLRVAREAGLTVYEEAGEIVVRGPADAAPIVRTLLDRKDVVLEALRFEGRVAEGRAGHRRPESAHEATPAFYAAFQPWPQPCWSCASKRLWRSSPRTPWTCGRCHPPLPIGDAVEWSVGREGAEREGRNA